VLSAVRRLVKNGEARHIRESAHLTQRDVAKAVGATGSTVSCWESGKHCPTGRAAIAYGRLLAAIVQEHRGDDDDSC